MAIINMTINYCKNNQMEDIDFEVKWKKKQIILADFGITSQTIEKFIAFNKL